MDPHVEQPGAAAPTVTSPSSPVIPPAPAPPMKGGELEGEDGAALVGIMYSEHTWVVPQWIKTAWLVGSIVAIGALTVQQADKRLEFHRLLADSVVEPTRVGNGAVLAPDIKLPVGNGGPIASLSEHRGQWVLVNFWATWCPPCRDEMPSLELLNRRMKDKGLVMIAVSVDDDYTEVNRFFADTQPTFQVLWDKEKVAANAYGTNKFPETYLIAPDGKVAAKFVGPRDWYNMGTVQYFDEVIAGKRKPVS